MKLNNQVSDFDELSFLEIAESSMRVVKTICTVSHASQDYKLPFQSWATVNFGYVCKMRKKHGKTGVVKTPSQNHLASRENPPLRYL